MTTEASPAAREGIVRAACPHDCPDTCAMLVTVREEGGKRVAVKIAGDPEHPTTSGVLCTKVSRYLERTYHPERILHPLKRIGRKGEGRFAQASWDEALDDIAARIRHAIEEDRRDEVIYHVGRPGEDGFVERVLLAWGVDGHNSHTNICSAGARLGYTLWGGYDRPSPDYANARVILLLTAPQHTLMPSLPFPVPLPLPTPHTPPLFNNTNRSHPQASPKPLIL